VINEAAMPLEFEDGERTPDAAARPRLSPMSDDETLLPEQSDRTAGARPSAAEPASLRDAEVIAARVAADEMAADAERDRLTREPLPVLKASPRIGFQLAAGERLHAERHAALLERGKAGHPSGGTLYVTSQRLVHVGGEAVEEFALDAITEMAVALERLLLIELADGSDLAIEVDRPRLLRVQVSAARAALRTRRA
jgi:hypothetical protein